MDQAIAHKNIPLAAGLCLMTLLVPVLCSLLSYWVACRTIAVPTEWAHQRRVAVLAKCFRLVTPRLSSELRGEMVNLWGSDIPALESWIMEIIPFLVSSVVRFGLSLLSMFMLQPTMAMIALGLCPLPLLIARVVNQRMRPVWASLQEKRASAFEAGLQMVDAYETVRLNGLESYVERQYGERSSSLLQASRKSVLVSKRWGILSAAANGMGPALLAATGAFLVMADQTTLGTLVAFSSALGGVQGPIAEISRYVVNMSKVENHAVRLCRYHDAPEEVRGTVAVGGDKPAEFVVEVQNLRVQLPSFTLTCDHLTIRRGEKIAVIGPSGAGKTTLLRAMSGLLVPDSGTVRVNGVDTTCIDPRSLREFAAFHPQSPALFPDTVHFNVSLGRPIPEEIVQRALASVGMSHILERGPVPKYADLSEGERQRLVLSRLLVDDRPLLFLDEPTSALDEENESRFLRELFHRKATATIIVVSHRPAILSYVDRVVEMSHGRVTTVRRKEHDKGVA